MMEWKENWSETRQHFLDWWDRKGLVLGMWGHGFTQPQDVIPLLDAVGPKGMYLMVECEPADEMEALAVRVEAYR